MDRRSKSVRGYVNFPVDNPEYKNSGEGGMYVQLVVSDAQKDFDKRWMICSGSNALITMAESLIGDDVHLEPKIDYVNTPLDKWRELELQGAENFHFPRIEKEEETSNKAAWGFMGRYLSCEYLAVVNLGSTGWSGWRVDNSGHWKCTYQDLTPEGQALYDQIKELYQGFGDLYLITWLDT